MSHQHLPGRRDIILKAIGAAGFLGLAKSGTGVALAQTSPSLVLTPEMTEGPYWVDGQLNRSDLLYDPTTQTIQTGFLLLLNINVYSEVDGKLSPLQGLYVDLWSANANGVYSDEAVEGTSGQLWLRGYQVTDANGYVHFLTIYPGWYSGRTPHVHCRVRREVDGQTTYNFTTQFFFDESITKAVYLTSPYNNRPGQDTFNSTDMIFSAQDCMTGLEEGQEMLLNLTKTVTYAVATIKIRLDLALPTNSTCSTGGGPGGPGGPGGSPSA